MKIELGAPKATRTRNYSKQYQEFLEVLEQVRSAALDAGEPANVTCEFSELIVIPEFATVRKAGEGVLASTPIDVRRKLSNVVQTLDGQWSVRARGDAVSVVFLGDDTTDNDTLQQAE